MYIILSNQSNEDHNSKAIELKDEFIRDKDLLKVFLRELEEHIIYFKEKK